MIMKEVTVYKTGNKWQRNRYSYMAAFNLANGISSFGESEFGNRYHHLVDPDAAGPEYNLLGDNRILAEVENRFRTKAGDKHRVLSNTVASQPCCFNLFAPLKFPENARLSNRLFSHLLRKPVEVEQVIIEFTPLTEESLGDQSAKGGTDSDVAVFYSYDQGEQGVLLIECKYIENEFSTCTSYQKKPSIRAICDCNSFHADKFDGVAVSPNSRPDCGYRKYKNWNLTKGSAAFSEEAITSLNHCPFRFSLNQLWRNMLLAENVARVRNLSEFHFGVLYPVQNTFLWKNNGEDVEHAFRNILTPLGNRAFMVLELEKDVVSYLIAESNTHSSKEWLKKFWIKYLTNVNLNESSDVQVIA